MRSSTRLDTPGRSRTARLAPWLVLALALAGCEGGPGRRPIRSPLPPPRGAPAAQALAGQVLTRSDSLTLPKGITRVGDKLVVLEALNQPAIQVFAERDGRLLASFGRKGGGPGEYTGVWSVDPVPGSPSEFWIYDLGQSRMTEIRLVPRPAVRTAADAGTAPLPDSAAVETMLNLVSPQGAILEPVWQGGRILSLGFFDAGRIGVFGADGRLEHAFGALPKPPSGIPMAVWRQAFQGRLQPNPDRSLLAVATRMADRLDIYSVDGHLVAHADRLYGFDPPAAVSRLSPRPALATGDTLRFGYIDLATTSRRIYALFSGRTRRGYGSRANFGRTIHVFDWQGHIRQVLTLPADAIAITVDPDEHELFAVQHVPTPSIVRYRLPAPLSSTRHVARGENE